MTTARSYDSKLFQNAQDRRQRMLPQPGDAQPEARQHGRAVDAIGADRRQAIEPRVVEMIELSLLAQRVDQPVLAHASGLILDELLASIAADALRRHDLDGEIGGTIKQLMS